MIKIHALLLVAGLAPLPAIPTIPELPPAQFVWDEALKKEAVECAVGFVLRAEAAMSEAHATKCNIILTDNDYANGKFSQFSQAVFAMITRYFEKRGYTVTSADDKNVCTIRLEKK